MATFDLGRVVGKDSLYEVNVTGTDGYMKFSNDIKECWGYGSMESGSGYIDVTLPIEFTDNNFNPMITGYQYDETLYIQYVTKNTMRVSRLKSENPCSFYYRCIGK